MDTNGGSKVHFQTFYLMQVSCYPKCKLQNTIGLMSLLRPLSELFALVFVTVVPFWLQCTPHNEINRGIHSVLQAFSLMKVDLQLDLNFVSQKKLEGKLIEVVAAKCSCKKKDTRVDGTFVRVSYTGPITLD